MFTSSGRLFHFWFLIALCIVYLLVGISNLVIEKTCKKTLQDIISVKAVVITILLLMEGVQLINIFRGTNGLAMIREIVFPEFRLITNIGYFMLGMTVHKGKASFCRLFKRTGLLIFACSLLYVELVESLLFHFTWASNYYDSIVVAIGCIAIVSYVCSHDVVHHAKLIEKLVQFSMPTYILHPLIIAVVSLILESLNLNTYILSAIELLAILIIVPVVTKVLRSLKMTFLIEL